MNIPVVGWNDAFPQVSWHGAWGRRIEGTEKCMLFKKLWKFNHHVFGSFGFTELRSQKHYLWCCTQQTSATQQKRGISIIAGPCHSWRSSSDRYLVPVLPLRAVITGEFLNFMSQWYSDKDYWDPRLSFWGGSIPNSCVSTSWSCDVWILFKFWFSEHYSISIWCISIWKEKKAFPCDSILSKCHLTSPFIYLLIYFSNGLSKWCQLWPCCGIKMGMFISCVCYNWLFLSSWQAMLFNSKTRYGSLGSGNH